MMFSCLTACLCVCCCVLFGVAGDCTMAGVVVLVLCFCGGIIECKYVDWYGSEIGL